jgi:hypothetical protein
LLESWWGLAGLVTGACRGAYAALKCICFCYLGVEWTLMRAPQIQIPSRELAWIALAGRTLVAATVSFCFVRAVPVLWEGRRYVSLAPAPICGISAGARPSAVRPAVAGAAR